MILAASAILNYPVLLLMRVPAKVHAFYLFNSGKSLVFFCHDVILFAEGLGGRLVPLFVISHTGG